MTLSSTTKASNKISLPFELQRTSLQQLYRCVTRYVSKSICEGTVVCNNSSRLVGAQNLHTVNSMKDKTQLPYVSSIFSSVSNLLTNLHIWFKPVLCQFFHENCQFFLNFQKPRTRGRFLQFLKV